MRKKQCSYCCVVQAVSEFKHPKFKREYTTCDSCRMRSAKYRKAAKSKLLRGEIPKPTTTPQQVFHQT